MVEIKCLVCDKTLELPEYIDSDNYDGQLVCSECKALLHVKLVKGKLRKYKIVERFRQSEPVKIADVIIGHAEAGRPFLEMVERETVEENDKERR